jgi:hypothetical protein
VQHAGFCAAASPRSVWLAFYFHRNDLLIETGIMKQVPIASLTA